PTERKLSGESVFFGGPVLRETIFALFQSRERPESPAFRVLRDVYLTMQPETVERLLARRGQRFRLYAGFSGWAPLQLQAELARDGWYVLPASVDLLFRKDTAGLWSELLAEARGEHAARENAARAALFHGGLRHSVETLRRRSVYFAYEESPLQPAAPRGVRASGAGVVSVAGGRDPARGAPRVPRQHQRSCHRDRPQRGALLSGLRRLASGRAEKRDRSRLVVGARRRRRSRLPQGHRRHVGGPPASHAPHPGQPLLLRFFGAALPSRAGIVAD